jgi:NADPH-dependent 2,4-dienoyl-CoA reductase/sulfur reductase-like enzyme/nitrite reductase/ring-hydroxylating ferredoxin subunit
MNELEVAVAKLSEIKGGEMKEVSVGDTKVLLARVGDKCFAVGAHCTHYGAPLVDGALVGDRIVCPWHHACFAASTGNLEEPPAIDSLPSYKLRTRGDDIFVDVDDQPDHRTPEMARAKPESDSRVFVILGGGAAGYIAAQTLREDGYKGRVLIVTSDGSLPYDRPNLSKDYLQGNAEPSWMPLRPDEFFTDHGIEVLRNKEVTAVDSASGTLTFRDGEVLAFDKLLVAVGGIPRKLDLPNAGLKNIFVLRSFDNADEIIAAAAGAKRAVVIGASFIGMEAAASLRQRGLSVTVIAPDTVPFAKTMGAEIGNLFRDVHEKHSVEFRLGSQVQGFEGDDSVNAVILDSGERVEADLVIAGIGVIPATKFIAGLPLHDDGGVVADEHLRVADNIYAAGDIVHFPDPRTGQSVRIEHWRTALQQGRNAAHNMAGKVTAFSSVPFFWTTQFDITLDYVGHAYGWDEIIFDGAVEKQDFLAHYIKDGQVQAVAGMNRARDLDIVEEFMRTGRMPSVESIRQGPIDFSRLINAEGSGISEKAS